MKLYNGLERKLKKSNRGYNLLGDLIFNFGRNLFCISPNIYRGYIIYNLDKFVKYLFNYFIIIRGYILKK